MHTTIDSDYKIDIASTIANLAELNNDEFLDVVF